MKQIPRVLKVMAFDDFFYSLCFSNMCSQSENPLENENRKLYSLEDGLQQPPNWMIIWFLFFMDATVFLPTESHVFERLAPKVELEGDEVLVEEPKGRF